MEYKDNKNLERHVAAKMRDLNLAILKISKSRWNKAVEKQLSILELLLYSGHEEDNLLHTLRVTLMLSKAAQRAAIGWKAHIPWMITTCLS